MGGVRPRQVARDRGGTARSDPAPPGRTRGTSPCAGPAPAARLLSSPAQRGARGGRSWPACAEGCSGLERLPRERDLPAAKARNAPSFRPSNPSRKHLIP